MNSHTEVGEIWDFEHARQKGHSSSLMRRTLVPWGGENWMSDCRKIQAMDVLLTQEWALTATPCFSPALGVGSGFRAAALTGTCKS